MSFFSLIDYPDKESLCLLSSFCLSFVQADPRFVWNKNLLEELIEAKVNIYEGIAYVVCVFLSFLMFLFFWIIVAA